MDFTNLDFTGVKPTSVPMETIEVRIDPKTMVDDYARAFVREVRRCDPRRFEQAPITDEEMIKYCRYILRQRIACVNDECKDWRVIKNLYIPVFIQYAISLVGIVQINDKGLTLKPIMDQPNKDEPEMKLSEALELSGRIGLYEKVVQVRLDAMPRDKRGDRDTMSCALIAGYVRSIDEVAHPVASYIAAFMGFTLMKESHFEVLYRTQYDDLEFIRAAMTNSRVVMGNGD